MRARILLLSAVSALTAATAALAQAPAAPTVQDAPALEGRKNQRVELIRVEDAAVSIDEVRYGGQTDRKSTRLNSSH